GPDDARHGAWCRLPAGGPRTGVVRGVVSATSPARAGGVHRVFTWAGGCALAVVSMLFTGSSPRVAEQDRNRRAVYRTRGVAVAALLLLVAACGSDNPTGATAQAVDESLVGRIDGAGSSAQESAMAAWLAGFQLSYPNVSVSYDPV